MLVKINTGIKIEKCCLEKPSGKQVYYTPQQNSLVEVGFYALVNKEHATMHHTNLPMEMQYCLFGEIFTTVTFLDGLTVVELDGKHRLCYKLILEKHQGFPIVCTLWVKPVQ